MKLFLADLFIHPNYIGVKKKTKMNLYLAGNHKVKNWGGSPNTSRPNNGAECPFLKVTTIREIISIFRSYSRRVWT